MFKRRIWQYDRGDYDLLRQKASSSDWNSLQNSDINIYTKNFRNLLIEMTDSCIPNRHVTIRPTEPPWITTLIKKNIYVYVKERIKKQNGQIHKLTGKDLDIFVM